MYPLPIQKLKVGFRVTATLGFGDVPPTRSIFFHFWKKATLDYVRPLGDVPHLQICFHFWIEATLSSVIPLGNVPLPSVEF